MLTPHNLESINMSSPVGRIRNNTEERIESDPMTGKLCFKENLKQGHLSPNGKNEDAYLSQ